MPYAAVVKFKGSGDSAKMIVWLQYSDFISAQSFGKEADMKEELTGYALTYWASYIAQYIPRYAPLKKARYPPSV